MAALPGDRGLHSTLTRLAQSVSTWWVEGGCKELALEDGIVTRPYQEGPERPQLYALGTRDSENLGDGQEEQHMAPSHAPGWLHIIHTLLLSRDTLLLPSSLWLSQ